MAISVDGVKRAVYQRKDDALAKLLLETSGGQVGLDDLDGKLKGDVQAELEALRKDLGGLMSAANVLHFEGVITSMVDSFRLFGPTGTVSRRQWEAGSVWLVGFSQKNAAKEGSMVSAILGGLKDFESGDLIIAIMSPEEAVEKYGTGVDMYSKAFACVQANIDGAVTNTDEVVDGNLAVFDGVSGKHVSDSGISAEEASKEWAQGHETIPDTMPESVKDNGILLVGA